MNNKIEILLHQALFETDDSKLSEDMRIPIEYAERLAELIIKECIYICNETLKVRKYCFVTSPYLNNTQIVFYEL